MLKNLLAAGRKKIPQLRRKISRMQITPVSAFIFFLRSWGRLIIIAATIVLFLYYPVGGALLNNIDTSLSYEPEKTSPGQSAAVNAEIFLINREVNDNLWTPGLPFFFPSYFLDNMPNFQLGIMDSAATFASALTKVLPPLPAQEDKNTLKTAAELLHYPGTVWLFAPDGKFLPAPSSAKQYRKALLLLEKYNQALEQGIISYLPEKNSLATVLNTINASLQKSNKELEQHIREFSSAWFDNKADNLFYFNRGKAYAAYIELKALGADYKEIIVGNGLYEEWTRALYSLENASALAPAFIRNGETNSLTAPNHLISLSYNILDARIVLFKISAKLTED